MIVTFDLLYRSKCDTSLLCPSTNRNKTINNINNRVNFTKVCHLKNFFKHFPLNQKIQNLIFMKRKEFLLCQIMPIAEIIHNYPNLDNHTYNYYNIFENIFQPYLRRNTNFI